LDFSKMYRVVSTTEMFHVELRFLAGHDERALDCVLQFAHVPGPLGLAQESYGRSREFLGRYAGSPAQIGEEVVRQQAYVFCPLAQWRKLDREDSDAVIEILAE